MAHNINIVKGKAAFASAREKAWHGLGQVLDSAMTSEVAIMEAGLNYTVDKRPNIHRLPSGIEIVSNNSFYTYRTDTEDILGDKLGSRYEVVQNKDAFKFFDAIVGEGEAIYETAGALGKGEIIFITAKLPSYIRVQGKDDIEKYLLFTMSHDGTSSIQAMFTPIRVVCNNTLNAALNSSRCKVNLRHTKSVHDNLKEAHRALGIANKLSEELGQIFDKMSRTKITDEQLLDYITLVMNPKMKTDVEADEEEKDKLSSRMKNIITDVYEYAYEGVGQDLDTCRGTVFGAYNAITGYYQNSKDYKDADTKMKNVILGTYYDVGQRALVDAWSLTKN